jgi:hypothetical protein
MSGKEEITLVWQCIQSTANWRTKQDGETELQYKRKLNRFCVHGDDDA